MNKAFVIGINGATASGKSLTAKLLQENLDYESVIFNQDHYYHPMEKQFKDENGRPNFDLPTALDLPLFESHLKDLIDLKDVKKERYNYNKPLNGLSSFVKFKARKLIIVEGMYVFKNMLHYYDHKIFVNSSKDLQLKRRLVRDIEERGYDKEDVLYKFDNHIDKPFEEHILPNLKIADTVIDNRSSIKDLEREIIKLADRLNKTLHSRF